MTGFDVTAAQLQVTATNVGQTAEEMQSQVAGLRSEVETLLASGWRGQAASGFAQGWQRWDDGAEQALSALTTMAELLAQNGRGYAETETVNSEDVLGSGSGL